MALLAQLTPHREFGYALVLYAVHTSARPDLSKLVDSYSLITIYQRTKTTLERYRELSPALTEDLRVLQNVYSRLWQEVESF
jgi:hypothetical protein